MNKQTKILSARGGVIHMTRLEKLNSQKYKQLKKQKHESTAN